MYQNAWKDFGHSVSKKAPGFPDGMKNPFFRHQAPWFAFDTKSRIADISGPE
jgi:hypothetical protein